MYATSLHLRLGVKDWGKLSSSIYCIKTSSIDCPGFILFLSCVNFFLICFIFLFGTRLIVNWLVKFASLVALSACVLALLPLIEADDAELILMLNLARM